MLIMRTGNLNDCTILSHGYSPITEVQIILGLMLQLLLAILILLVDAILKKREETGE